MSTPSTDDLLRRIGDAQAQVRDRDRAERHGRVLDRLQASIEEEKPAPARRGWVVGGVALLSAAAALALWMMRPSPLTFEVEASSQAIASQSVVVADDEPLTMRFSDGSTIELQPGTRVRVGEPRVDGADLVLERGIVETSLEPGGTWTLVAGPHTLQLRGGVSRIEWTPEDERLIVADGPGEAVAMAEAPEIVIDETPEPAMSSAAEPEPAVVEPEPRKRTPRVRTPEVEAPPTEDAPERVAEDWRGLARRGAHREALAKAEAEGFAGLCDSLDAEVLLQLADTARYARKGVRAREALDALRRRFPGSDAAATAAFDLGRLAKPTTPGCAKWFRTYLEERPLGPLADAARQRLADCETPDPAE